MASFDDLPEDLLEYIFLHLSPYGELQTCRRVCKQWDRLAIGASVRLRSLFRRCSAFDWFLLQRPEREKFVTTIAERCSHAACYHPNGYVFVFGGCTAAYTTFNDLWRFDLSTRTWFRPVPMGSYPTPKACSSMVEYKGSLILFGGWSKSSPNPIHQTAMFYNELHVYDPTTNFWTQIANDGTAPHLAGHSATMVCDGGRMVVFGGSHGTVSSNQVWVFDVPTRTWYTPPTTSPKPMPRYGQSQVLIDDSHVLIIGGCGGPNLIFSDVWLLTMTGDVWQWHEITVLNGHLSAPQLWSHPACKVGKDKLVVLSKPPRQCVNPSAATTTSANGSVTTPMSTSGRMAGGTTVRGRSTGGWVPPQGNLIPPRRKLITSRSLDEDDQSSTSGSSSFSTANKSNSNNNNGNGNGKSAGSAGAGAGGGPGEGEKKSAELQRAHSIPAIIVGEIPKLVVTEDENSAGEAAGESSSGRPPAQCIAVVASSLLPQHASTVEMPSCSSADDTMMMMDTTTSSGHHQRPRNPAAALPRGPPQPSNGNGNGKDRKDHNNREKQLEVLRRMEEYIRSKSQSQSQQSSHYHQQQQLQRNQDSADLSENPTSSSSSMKFRPSSPPPKTKQQQNGGGSSGGRLPNTNSINGGNFFHHLSSKTPMRAYVLDLSKVLLTSEEAEGGRSVTWTMLEGNIDAPEDTILYSLVQGRGELILFGGMRSNPTEQNQGLDVTPFSHTITNETYILRPPINL